jgi:hypothetical protein
MRLMAFVCLLWVGPALAGEVTSLDFGVGFRGFGRSFGPTDGTRTVGSWSGSGMGVVVEGQWFPAATMTKSFLGYLGVVGEGQASLGLATEYGAAKFATRATLVRGALAAKVPFGAHALLITTGVGSQYFGVASTAVDGATRPAVYDVNYFGPRAAIALRLALSSAFALGARVGALFTVARGELDTAFVRASAFGLDAQLGVTFAVLPQLLLRANADFAHQFVALGSGHTAGDTTFGGSFAVALAL